MKALAIVNLSLELLGLLLIAGAAGAAAWTYVALWAGLLAAGVVVLGGAFLADRNLRGDRGAAVRPSAPRN